MSYVDEDEQARLSASSRYRNPPLSRTQPHRHFGTAVRSSTGWQVPGAGSHTSDSPGANSFASNKNSTAGWGVPGFDSVSGLVGDSVSAGVRLGYEVIDEYLDQAKRMAQSYSAPGSPNSDMFGSRPQDPVDPLGLSGLAGLSAGPGQEWLQMMMGLYQQTFAMAMQGWGQTGPWMDTLGRLQSAAAVSATGHVSPQGPSFPIVVQCAEPCRVKLDLHDGFAGVAPEALNASAVTSAANQGEPPDVTFAVKDGALVVDVQTAEQVQPGQFHAVVCTQGGQACGTLSMEILAQPEPPSSSS